MATGEALIHAVAHGPHEQEPVASTAFEAAACSRSLADLFNTSLAAAIYSGAADRAIANV
jgi:hypothetical protein